MPAEAVATSRRERRKQEVRDRIVAASERLFAAQGYDGTTVDQIAEAADVAQKTFFNHFPTKHALLTLLAEARLDRMYAELEEVRCGRAATGRKLALFFDRSGEHAEAEDLLVRDVALELRRLLTPGADAAGAEASRLHRLFGAILRDGQDAGDVRADLDAEFLAEMVLGAFGAVWANWASGSGYPVGQRLQQTAAFIGEAIAPPRATGRGRVPRRDA